MVTNLSRRPPHISRSTGGRGDTELGKDASVCPDRTHGAHEYEAKEHDLSMVR